MGNVQVTSQRKREEALQGIKDGSVDFEDLPKAFRDDAEIALEVVRKRPWWNWETVSSRLKNNKAFILTAVRETGWFLEHASEDLRADRDVVLSAVQQNGYALQHASEELRGDREVVIEAVRKDGYALRHASEELRADRDIVLTAVRQYGYALQHASEELRADREIVYEAVRQKVNALQYASEDVLADKGIVMTAVRKHGKVLRYASNELRGNREIVLTAVMQSPEALEFASAVLRADRQIVLAAIESTRDRFGVEDVLTRVPRFLQNDPRIAGAMIRKGKHLRQHSEILARLKSVLCSVQTLPEDFTNFADEPSFFQSCGRWERSIWQRIWMVLQLGPASIDGIGRLIVEQSGLLLELQLARNLCHCAPVFAAVISLSLQRRSTCDWRDIRLYFLSSNNVFFIQ